MYHQRLMTLMGLLACLFSASFAFSATTLPPQHQHQTATTTPTTLHAEGTGGWGLGNAREMVPEEFAKGGEKKAFEGYKMEERGQFMRRVREDAQDMRNSELDELLGVAKIAGIKVKDPSERLNKFDSDLMNEEEEDLDLSV